MKCWNSLFLSLYYTKWRKCNAKIPTIFRLLTWHSIDCLPTSHPPNHFRDSLLLLPYHDFFLSAQGWRARMMVGHNNLDKPENIPTKYHILSGSTKSITLFHNIHTSMIIFSDHPHPFITLRRKYMTMSLEGQGLQGIRHLSINFGFSPNILSTFSLSSKTNFRLFVSIIILPYGSRLWQLISGRNSR